MLVAPVVVAVVATEVVAVHSVDEILLVDAEDGLRFHGPTTR